MHLMDTRRTPLDLLIDGRSHIEALMYSGRSMPKRSTQPTPAAARTSLAALKRSMDELKAEANQLARRRYELAGMRAELASREAEREAQERRALKTRLKNRPVVVFAELADRCQRLSAETGEPYETVWARERRKLADL